MDSSRFRFYRVFASALIVALSSAGTFAQFPERVQIAFSTDRDGNWEVYTMDNRGDRRGLTTVVESSSTLPVIIRLTFTQYIRVVAEWRG